MAEIYGTLVDFDTKGNICLAKSIISINRMVVDPASITNKIIKYNYDESEGSTISSILGPMYNNHKDKSIVWLNLSNFVLVPIHDNDTELDGDNKTAKEMVSYWIDNVYDNYKEIRELLDIDTEDTTEYTITGKE